jgi:hypothetical protein
LVPDSVVVPGPEVVPVPEAPMLLAPVLVLGVLLVVVLVLLGVLLVVLLVPVVPDVVEERVVDWHPAARTAARVRVSRAAGRMVDVKAIGIPR